MSGDMNSELRRPLNRPHRFIIIILAALAVFTLATARYERESRGGPPYHPRMMVEVLVYGYCVRVASSRRIAQRLHEDIAFRVLSANNTPDFRTISDFRKDNGSAPNIVELAGTVRRTKLLVRQWLHPATIAVAV